MITRRDFLDGVAFAVGAALLPSCKKPPPPFAPERDPSYYPPARTGLRGSHVGSFEIAHQLVAGTLGELIANADAIDERYDLIVVGGGISGLAAAHLYRKRHGDSARVLVLDNHDDFGGHAKRNEFSSGGRTLLSAGGSYELTAPSLYNQAAKDLLAELALDEPRFDQAFPAARAEHGLGSGMFFAKEIFGRDALIKGALDPMSDDILRAAPVSDAVRAQLVQLYRNPAHFWPEIALADKHARLAKMSYRAFLLDVAKLSADALPFLQTATHDLYGVGIDAVPALDAWGIGLPGFDGLELGDKPLAPIGRTPAMMLAKGSATMHFADGNASVARLLVRRLVPGALDGNALVDLMPARARYAALDDAAHPVRIRLNSTAVRVRNLANEVEVAYVRGGRAFSVRGGACVLACWHAIIPHLAPELPASQKAALAKAVKVPLVYANAALRDTKAFRALGVSEIQAPGAYFTGVTLESPIDTTAGTMHAADEPAVVKLIRTPCKPGLSAHDQHRAGRAELLATPFDVFETQIKDQLARMLAGTGFDPARDLTAITVNRWSHGYSYEYNALFDPDYPPGQAPCELARARLGRIAIANADAGAYAYADGAIAQAARAIDDLG